MTQLLGWLFFVLAACVLILTGALIARWLGERDGWR